MKKILPVLIFILTLSSTSFSQCGIVGIPTQMLQGTSVGIQNTNTGTVLMIVLSGDYPITIGLEQGGATGNVQGYNGGQSGSVVADPTTLLGTYQIEINDLLGCVETVTIEVITALPVELINFTGRQTNKKTTLQWQTASETNNEGFEIQHSTNGLDWEVLDFIKGGGTTFETQNYTYEHQRPNQGTNYYRLKQLDHDGVFEYSKIIVIEVASKGSGFTLFPNPIADGFRQISLQSNLKKPSVFTLYNQMGQQVYQMPIAAEAQYLDIQLPALISGFYTAVLESGRERFVERLMVR